MKTIDTISSIEGRLLLQEVFNELRYEKQLSSMQSLILCWRICTHETDVFKYVNKEFKIAHKLGFFSGTGLWMEEIVNRFYFSTINSFVYFGAAVLLVLIGIRRFSDNVSDSLVIVGVAFEASMLIFMFIVMFFTPQETDVGSIGRNNEKEDDFSGELITEVGEIARDFAAAVVQLEMVGNTLKEILKQQEEMKESMKELSEHTAQAVSPNPKLLDSMKETNQVLERFKNTVDELNVAAILLKREEIEIAVRNEVEKILGAQVRQITKLKFGD